MAKKIVVTQNLNPLQLTHGIGIYHLAQGFDQIPTEHSNKLLNGSCWRVSVNYNGGVVKSSTVECQGSSR